MTLQEVIEQNRARQKRARELNARAGKTVFVVFTAEMVEQALSEMLPKAKRAADIPYPEDFLLPPLDAAEAARVEAECPDTMSVLGRERKIIFRHEGPPRIVFGVAELKDLPAEIRLPDGRAAEAGVELAEEVFYGTDIPQLKEQVRERLNRRQWDKWEMFQRQEKLMHLEYVPAVKTAEYGKCALTNEPLLAYGAAKLSRFGYFGDTVDLRETWFRTREEAERERELSALYLQAERERKEIERLSSWRGGFYYGEFGGPAKRARDFSFRRIPTDKAGLANWHETARAIRAELVAAGQRADVQARELEKQRQAQEASRATVAGLRNKFNRK